MIVRELTVRWYEPTANKISMQGFRDFAEPKEHERINT
jgi:hypothetical protein